MRANIRGIREIRGPILSARRSPSEVLHHPIPLRVFKILLRIDFDIAARRVDVTESLALFDHVLEQQNLVCVFEIASIPPRLASELLPPTFIIFAQAGSAGW